MKHIKTDKPQKNDIVEVMIEDIGFEGSGIGKINDNFAVFVPYTVPQDLIRASILKTRKNLSEAKLLEIVKPSHDRIKAECTHFGTCNGCKMQHISYDKQLELKRNAVVNAFERIGGFKGINVQSVIKADNIFYYRNKLEFSFSANKWLTQDDLGKEDADNSFALGFHKPGFIDKVIDIEKCHLQSDLSNILLNATRDFFKSKGISVYSTKTHSGFLRFLIIRQSANTTDVMINLITYEDDDNLLRGYAEHILSKIPENRVNDSFSVVHSVSTKKAQVAQADRSRVLHGKGFIEEKLGNLIFRISPFAFFQTNSKQCEKLYDIITQLADFGKDDTVLDLYCGCGAISLYISGLVNSVHGVELSDAAIESANENADLNNITSFSFEASDVKDYLSHLRRGNNRKYSTVILDPPRSGIHPKAAEYLLEIEPKKIIYVSCNPTTQARDIRLLADKYDIISMQPVDMFPHTFHIENVVRLDLRA